ncbi:MULTISPECIES: leucyl aminopeptidase [Streptomyces]|uniref:Probable cytosol aminopeptidase n=1 Tax=Streptomyces tsukubensis (strain DSM 42081 / NBRC 108919 / NRRL 18488 / 9993) TaxID=1114943 RepID=I2MX46_STRT9|nr:leucyl aminopeptidase [Streptomyces tsukubensis]MYS66060.1 leucyl aminopeptidase [Streptomyces sp. SID5473]AZK93739.1 leucyl aminopeptidase [Streptomyces tsukubensis]EIF89343.1 multifunctional aminopeptidase A [Streptomyces tsukubensis NRRL18488]QKM70121.1 leucyl aminopeptidase [Streptomyces tsukubensis NRRL18488]TAI45901.1 leucyl aminopeptidase [Streptomyces tsukubensis]
MTALTLSTAGAATLRADAVVVGVAKGAKGPVVAPGAEAVDTAFDGTLATVLDTLGASGAEGEAIKLPSPAGLKAPVVLAVGLGAAPKDGVYGAEALRRAAGTAARALTGAKKAAFALPIASPADAEAIAEGALLGAYAFTAYQGVDGKGGGKAPLAEVALLGAKPRDKAYKTAAERALVVAEEINRSRDLINTPPNDLTPEAFAAVASAAGKEVGVKVQILDEKALVKGGFGGILGVGQGSVNPPRLVKLVYTHSKDAKHLALVGKGITYDSGGISLKPAGHNETMKCDMSGAAAVFAAVVAAARLGLPVNVTGWLALAENMPSGSATRPGDVLRMYSGKTVEVLNTDAEGRLVLADALWKASEENPDAIVDVATLTGAMVLALGNRTFGVMANDDDFRTAVHETAAEVGEQSWPMPLPAELRKGMDSPTADIANMGERMGGGLVAGLFLQEFVGEGITWAHLDIAGPAFHEGAPYGYTPKGGTGSSVRTLVRLAEKLGEGDLG